MEERIVGKYIREFNERAQKAVTQNAVNKAYTAIRISAEIQYQWNQSYTDDSLEDCIKELVSRKQSVITDYITRGNVVLFYDGFGLDTRGLALIYLKALCDLNYAVVYVVPEKARNQQPEIHKVTAGKDITFHYLQNAAGDEMTTELLHVFSKYQPHTAFFYTHPADVEACVAFGFMAGKVRRYQINLTDHAFWLGKNAFDYCIEFREYGACVSAKYRQIPQEQLRLMHYYPYFDKNIPFAGLPFETEGRPILFSGGSLYKTYDDKGTYYAIVAEILQRHRELLFVYAGTGDKSGLNALQAKFLGRVFVMAERKDLYAVMQHVTLYLNTYPMIGGLMTQYAAIAGKLPLTLFNCPENSLDGLLLNHENMQLEFQHKDDVIAEMDRLLVDESYRQQAEARLADSVINEEKFRQELGRLLKVGENKFTFTVHDVDTSAFRQQYIHRFTLGALACTVINKKTVSLWMKYPKLLCYRIMQKLRQK